MAHLPELTRVADTDGDGKADLYETVSDAWGWLQTAPNRVRRFAAN